MAPKSSPQDQALCSLLKSLSFSKIGGGGGGGVCLCCFKGNTFPCISYTFWSGLENSFLDLTVKQRVFTSTLCNIIHFSPSSFPTEKHFEDICF